MSHRKKITIVIILCIFYAIMIKTLPVLIGTRIQRRHGGDAAILLL